MDKNIKEFNETAELLKVIAHPVRLCIIKGLIEKGQCNVSHMQTCLELPQSTVSQHLQKLRTAGVLKGVRKGVEINYDIADDRIVKLFKALFP